MRLTVIGSSDAFNSAGRGHSCYLLEGAGRAPLMVDFGATALAGLGRLGLDPRAIGGIAVTHLHGDHLGGLPFLVIDGMFNRFRTAPLELLGPPGLAERADAFLRTAYGSLADRERPFELRIRELAPGEEADLLGARVRAFAADHMDPPDVPVCLRIQGVDGRIAAFSGDTALCEGLFAAADGAHLFVAECTAMRPPAGRHCTWEEWKVALPRVRAKRMLLTHLGADVRAMGPELVKTAPVGPSLAIADDGQRIEV